MKTRNTTRTWIMISRVFALMIILAGTGLYYSCNRGTGSSGEIERSVAILTFDATDDQAGDTTQWRPLFNGKDLTGWKHVGNGSMSVEEGLIRGHGGMGLLYWTGEKFGNCKIRVVFKMEKVNSNSGVFVRIPIEPMEEWMPVFYGHEIQIDNMPELSDETEYHSTGIRFLPEPGILSPSKVRVPIPGTWVFRITGKRMLYFLKRWL